MKIRPRVSFFHYLLLGDRFFTGRMSLLSPNQCVSEHWQEQKTLTLTSSLARVGSSIRLVRLKVDPALSLTSSFHRPPLDLSQQCCLLYTGSPMPAPENYHSAVISMYLQKSEVIHQQACLLTSHIWEHERKFFYSIGHMPSIRQGNTEWLHCVLQQCKLQNKLNVVTWLAVKQLTHLHDFHKWDNAVHVFPCSYQSLQHQDLVVFEHVAANSSHHLYS